MSPEEAGKLAGKHATGNLSPAEAQALYRAAAQHQDIFDDLLGEELVRMAIEDPAHRDEIVRALRQSLPRAPETPWHRFLLWLQRPMVLAATASLAASAAVFLVVLNTHSRPKPTEIARRTEPTPPAQRIEASADLTDPRWGSALFSLPLTTTRSATLTGPAPSYRLGDDWHILFSVEEDSNVVIVELGPTGRYRRLFPNSSHVSAFVQSGELMQVPAAGQVAIKLPPPAGEYRLRMAVLPKEIDPLSAAFQWSDLPPGAFTVFQRSYRVEK